jgi:ribokinase
MRKIFVAGLINIETTLQIESFPIPYFPVRFPFFGINSSVSGVGFNVSKALTTLGNKVNFASLIGNDFASEIVRKQLMEVGISDRLVLSTLESTAQSVILYDPSGKRQIHTDLKDIQEKKFNTDFIQDALDESDIAIVCDINFARPFLKLAKGKSIPVATDAHTIDSIEDPYHQEFFENANILFLSDEKLHELPEVFAKKMINRFGIEIVVIGMGEEGALMVGKGAKEGYHLPPVRTRKIVNTIGAGDALFSCFIHEYAKHYDPYLALKKAIVFASYKIGTAGAADGFLDEQSLENLFEQVYFLE